MMTMISILKVPTQEKAPDQHARVTEHRKAESAGCSSVVTTGIRATAGVSSFFAAWYVKACLAIVIAVIVAGVVSVVSSMVSASVLAVAEILAIAALVWLRHNRKKEVGGRR